MARRCRRRPTPRAPTPKLKDELAALTKKVEEADAKIRDAAKPQKLHFEIVPAP